MLKIFDRIISLGLGLGVLYFMWTGNIPMATLNAVMFFGSKSD